MKRKGKGVAAFCFLAALVAGATLLYYSQNTLLELWYLQQFDSVDLERQVGILEKLSRIGSKRSAEKSVELLKREELDTELQKQLVSAVAALYPRVGSTQRRLLLDALWRDENDWFRFDPSRQLIKIADEYDDAMGFFFERLADRWGTRDEVAWTVSLKAWHRQRPALEPLLTRISPQQCVGLLGRCGRVDDSFDSGPAAGEIAEFLSGHADDRVRAVALSFRILRRDGCARVTVRVEPIADAYRDDRSLLVKKVALRLTGFLGPRPGGLDLSKLLFEETNSELLIEVIQARRHWAIDFRIEFVEVGHGALELWDQFICDWIPQPSWTEPAKPWTAAEMERLQELLLTSMEPELRDACSSALAGRYRDISPGSGRLPTPLRVAGLKAHEWGVWKDAGGSSSPSSPPFPTLPEFVHASKGTSKTFSRERSRFMEVLRPVVWFYTPKPISVYIRLDFAGGVPWRFFPEATDYVDTDVLLPTLKRRSQASEGKKGPQASALLEGKLNTDAGGTGLEWCGLRIGYDPKLESAAGKVESTAWWEQLRSVPSAEVALRGGRERFLLCDGIVGLPGPIELSWADATKSELVLRVRSFDEYPELWEHHLWWFDDEQRKKHETAYPIPFVFLISRRGGQLKGGLLRGLKRSGNQYRVPLDRLGLEGDELIGIFQRSLRERGLSVEESKALLNTCREAFFQTDGLRAITFVPTWMVNAVLPLEILPVPEEITRVGLVWKECDGLKVDPASDGANQEWHPEPWNIRRESIQIHSEVFNLGAEVPLRLNKSGNILLERGKPGSPSLSGDGKRVAFSLLDGISYGIHLADLEKKTLREVFAHSDIRRDYPGKVSLSADGQRVAYSMTQGRTATSYVLDLREKRAYHLLDHQRPQLSFDGRFVLAHKGDPQRSLVVVDLVAREESVVLVQNTRNALAGSALSQGGRSVAFLFSGDVYFVDLERETILRLSAGLSSRKSPLLPPVLSGDGTKVVFEKESERDYDIYLADIRGRTLTNLTDRPGMDRFPTISADGRKVFYRDSDARRLYVVDLVTGEKRPVRNSGHLWNVTVSSDGHVMATWEQKGERPYVRVWDVD